MKLIIFLFSFPVFADNWVRISDVQSGRVRGFELERDCVREGAVCQKIDGLNFAALKVSGGRIVEDAVKLKEIDDKDKAEKKKQKDRSDRLARMDVECAKSEGLVKELCEHVLDK